MYKTYLLLITFYSVSLLKYHFLLLLYDNTNDMINLFQFSYPIDKLMFKMTVKTGLKFLLFKYNHRQLRI